MGLIDKIKNMVTEDPDDKDYYRDDEQEDEFEEEDYFSDKPSKSKAYRQETDRRPSVNSGIQVVLVKPERFDDAPSIADHLCQKKTVVLNLEAASKEVSKRLIDFLSGVAYANKGQIKRVANSTFIITPVNVDVTGDLILEELESGTLYL